MKIQCDICGGELVMLPGGKGGACKNCGMEHSVERIREMLGMSGSKAEKPMNKTPSKQVSVSMAVPEEHEELTESSESDFVLKKRFGSVELKAYRGNAQRVIFPNKNIEISDCHIFEGHDEIVELVFQGGFSNTGCECGIFAGLKNLKRVICNNDMLAFDGEFKGCPKLEEVTITNAQLIQLNGAVFADCVNLKRVELDLEAQMDIGQSAFKNCKALASFVHPKRSVYFTDNGISSSAFEGCSALRNVVLADDTTAIHKHVFKGCTSLARVTTHSGGLDGIAIHPEAFAGASFKPVKAGICPNCGRTLNCTDNELSCSCGFSAVQYG